MSGAADDLVLARAMSEGRLLLSFDKEFGSLDFQHGSQASMGVVLFRITLPSASATAEAVTRILAPPTDCVRHFGVVDDRTIRMRSLP